MIELGLEKISRLLAKTPLPWRAVHVAGTNGKGSVCANISAMLNAYNRSKWRQLKGAPMIRHGRYTSPHVLDRWDCISLSSDDGFMEVVDPDLFREMEHKVLARNKRLEIEATEFELLTATAFEIFTRAKLDVAVIETGMGGRLDATNIIGRPVLDQDGKPTEAKVARPPPLVTAITKIGLDHQAFLGDTVEAIAKEKSGIFKAGAPVAWDTTNENAVQSVLRAEAESKGAPYASALFTQTWPKIGRHQGPNHELASKAGWLALKGLGCDQDLQAVATTTRISSGTAEQLHTDDAMDRARVDLIKDLARAPEHVLLPGRGQWIDLAPFLIQTQTPHDACFQNLSYNQRQTSALLDGAHNAQAAKRLSHYIDKIRSTNNKPFDNGPVTYILAASDTKDIKEILPHYLSHPHDRLLAVEFGPVAGMPWVHPLPSTALVKAAQTLNPAIHATAYGTDLPAALRAAFSDAPPDSSPLPLVITGSLYLVGDVHRLLRASIKSLKAPIASPVRDPFDPRDDEEGGQQEDSFPFDVRSFKPFVPREGIKRGFRPALV